MHHNLIRFSIAALASLVIPACAQQFVPKSIQFNGDPEFSKDELPAASGLKKGAVLNYAQMNEVSKRLMDTGMFASLTFKFDGQDLVFQLTPADQLMPIHFDNLPLALGPELDTKLHQQLPLYHGKVPGEGGVLEPVRASLEEMLSAEGIKANVLATPAADPRSHHVNAIHFTIASPPVQVDVRQVDGGSAEFQEKLQAIATEASKIPYDSDSSAANIEQAFTLFYHDRGYAAVNVHAERIATIAAEPALITVPFAVQIKEGRIYKLGGVHLPDNTPVTQADVSKTLTATPNGPVDGVRIRSLWALIVGHYHAKGYLDCKLTPTPQFDEATSIVNYDLAVEPGPVYHLAFVKFDNVSDELRTLLIRNWQMLPGDVFNESYVSNFIATAQQNDPVLRRSLANVKTSFNAMADPQTHDVNVVVRLEKR